jgi:hypothetical protein
VYKARALAINLTLIAGLFAGPASAYSVLTHEAIVDSLWDKPIKQLLQARFPDATEDQLTEAHGYAYGGCIIQDIGYYPFGNHFFSDLVHYVRSAGFVDELLRQSETLDEYAFALGALAHYGADNSGHSIAINRAVPILYPKLREKYGNVVTYDQSPAAHIKTEFGFDVMQVARGRYASKAYHDFIGFQVSKELLDRATEQVYGLKLKDIFKTLDLTLGSYRFAVSSLIPEMTKAAWSLKKKDILKSDPKMTRNKFLYNLSRASYHKEFGRAYEHPGFFARLLAVLFRLIPKVGPFQALGFKAPTTQTELMFEQSFDNTVDHDREYYAEVAAGKLKIADTDLDTGKPTKAGEYGLADRTYGKLLEELARKHFQSVTPELRTNILAFYSTTSKAESVKAQPALDELKAK